MILSERKRPFEFRWLKPHHWGASYTSQVGPAGTVYLLLVDVPHRCVVDAIGYSIGATASGNVTVGLYGPLATEETPDGVPLVVSAEAVQGGRAAYSAHTIAVSDTILSAGRYYLALEMQDGIGTFIRNTNQQYVSYWGAYYNRGGGYGALTTPCPATNETSSALPLMSLRVKKVLL